jgi:hypothetical protein
MSKQQRLNFNSSRVPQAGFERLSGALRRALPKRFWLGAVGYLLIAWQLNSGNELAALELKN